MYIDFKLYKLENGFLYKSLLISLLLIPIASLFWPLHLFNIKANWLPFILLPSSILWTSFFEKETRQILLKYMVLLLIYGVVFYINSGEPESLVRMGLCILPIVFKDVIQSRTDNFNYSFFWSLYAFLLLIPLVISVLQILGYFPFYDTGDALGLIHSGRISGGYMKPNNLIAYIFPVYLLGFYLYFKNQKLKGSLIIGVCLIIVVLTGLRTAIIAYGLILFFSNFQPLLNKLIYLYYKNHVPFIAGIVGLFLLNYLYDSAGIMDGLRFRLPMWQAHANHFFDTNLYSQFFGSGKIDLPSSYYKMELIKSLNEAHNNALRILITFGILGFFLYCLLLRNFVISIQNKKLSNPHRFIHSSCFLFFMIYSVTNEPLFYVSILWCIIFWTLLSNKGYEF